MRKIIGFLLWLVLIVIYVASFAGRFGTQHWFADLLSHWQLQYALGGFLIVLLGLVFKRFILAFVALMMTFSIMALYLMPVFGGGDEVENVDLYFLNAGYGNQDTAPILASIREHDPEFINIVELSEGLATSIKELGYLPKYEHFNKYDSLGWYVHPRWKNKTAQEGVDDSFPYPVGSLCIGDLKVGASAFEHDPCPVKVFTFHPYPPFVEEVWSNQQVVFQQVSDLITADPEQPFILLGDLNSTPYSAIFKEHFGEYSEKVLYTWNRKDWGSPWGIVTALPIDHAFGTARFKVMMGEEVGSDHRPLLIDLYEGEEGLFTGF